MSDLFGGKPPPQKPGPSYSAADIEVLEGLEPVRRRPGMYIGGTDENAMHHLAAEIIDKGLKYRIDVSPLEGGAFFSVQPKGGVLLVTLNTEHPAYGLLLGARDPKELPDDPDKLKEKLQSAQSGLEMMLFAWARYEDEQLNEQRRVTQNIRHDWGRMAEAFLTSRP